MGYHAAPFVVPPLGNSCAGVMRWEAGLAIPGLFVVCRKG